MVALVFSIVAWRNVSRIERWTEKERPRWKYRWEYAVGTSAVQTQKAINQCLARLFPFATSTDAASFVPHEPSLGEQAWQWFCMIGRVSSGRAFLSRHRVVIPTMPGSSSHRSDE